ncbi:MAG TPA: TetR family transcriptional regulator C-terminal domain-containing protein [Acidimicrobiales bacterium]|nr:TetR family transcriptional regulator C-terminal domain-containing protein [Acidimicrobiales bacterium]
MARVRARPPADRTRFAVLKVRELQERGELAACVDPEAMSALLIAVANGLALQVTVDPDGAALDAMAGQFASLLLAARRP